MALTKKEISRLYRERNHERLRKKEIAKYQNNKQYYKKVCAHYYSKNKKKIIKKTTLYKKINREKVIAQRKIWRLKNIDNVHNQYKLWWHKNKEIISVKRKEHREFKKCMRQYNISQPFHDKFYENLWNEEYKRQQAVIKANEAWLIHKKQFRPDRKTRQALYNQFYLRNKSAEKYSRGKPNYSAS